MRLLDLALRPHVAEEVYDQTNNPVRGVPHARAGL